MRDSLQKALRNLILLWRQREATNQEWEHYLRMQQHPGWVIHQKMLLYVQAALRQTLISKEFTDLKMEDKDVLQRTYQSIDGILDVLMNPMAIIEPTLKVREEAKRRGQPPKKKTATQ
jgi:hypothetical protein